MSVIHEIHVRMMKPWAGRTNHELCPWAFKCDVVFTKRMPLVVICKSADPHQYHTHDVYKDAGSTIYDNVPINFGNECTALQAA